MLDRKKKTHRGFHGNVGGWQEELYNSLYSKLCSLAAVVGLDEEQLKKYFNPIGTSNYLYQLASSLQNSGNMCNSIRYNDPTSTNEKIIRSVLDNATMYRNWEELYQAMIAAGIRDGGVKKGRETNWQKYCRGLFDGITYLKNGGEEKIRQLCSTSNIDEIINDEIIEIQKTIHGLGFALTCDWLKECGCTWLAKPDIHIKKVAGYIRQTFDNGDESLGDWDVIEFVYDWAKEIGKTAYEIDKIIWLLCTGDFYLNGIKIGRPLVEQTIKSIKK